MPSFDWLNDVAFSQALHMDSFRLVLHHCEGHADIREALSNSPHDSHHSSQGVLRCVFSRALFVALAVPFYLWILHDLRRCQINSIHLRDVLDGPRLMSCTQTIKRTRRSLCHRESSGFRFRR